LRLQHFEALHPVCPRCLYERGVSAPLILAKILIGHDDVVEEGVIHCSAAECMLEYPIIDGVPIIMPNLRGYLAEQQFAIAGREDLSETIETLLGDAIGPGTHYDSLRQHISSYAWDGYGDLDPKETCEPGIAYPPRPGSVVRCLEQGLDLLRNSISAPMLDVGCAVGRSSFELAGRCDGLVLGVDVNFSMLRLAQRALQKGIVRYPRRRVGVVFDRREFNVSFAGRDQVDFWACDALALPFVPGSFGLVVGLNVLDCTSSPLDFLSAMGSLLRPGGATILSTPYDWSQGVTQIEGWIGGHSQRGTHGGSSEALLRALLTPGGHPQSVEDLCLFAEAESVPWQVRLHERSTISYSLHLFAAEARSST